MSAERKGRADGSGVNSAAFRSDGAQPQDREPIPFHDALPDRVVVGANGAYWRDLSGFYSMCPVSDDNDPVEIVAVYERVPFDPTKRVGSAVPSAESVAAYHRELEGLEAATREPGTIA